MKKTVKVLSLATLASAVAISALPEAQAKTIDGDQATYSSHSCGSCDACHACDACDGCDGMDHHDCDACEGMDHHECDGCDAEEEDCDPCGPY